MKMWKYYPAAATHDSRVSANITSHTRNTISVLHFHMTFIHICVCFTTPHMPRKAPLTADETKNDG